MMHFPTKCGANEPQNPQNQMAHGNHHLTTSWGIFFIFSHLKFKMGGYKKHTNSHTDVNDFAHIPWEGTPDFPKPPQRTKFLQKLLVQGQGYLPGDPVG